MSGPIKNIVIVGGGTAGWMMGAALSNVLDKSYYSISLIESKDIGTIGVGEATIPPIVKFNKMLGVNEDEFIRKTHGTFKLGIQFENWGKLGECYMHPFGSYGTNLGNLAFYNYWLKYFAEGKSQDIGEFSISYQAAKNGKFMRPANMPNSPLSQITYAYHFDASSYAAFLREYAEQRGLQRIEDTVDQVILASEDGTIDRLQLSSGKVVDGDFYIDCTGFKGLLMQQSLNSGFVDWSNYLLCDRAVAAPTQKRGDNAPFTRAIAQPVGWQWRIPLQTRIGNGYVYSSRYLSDDEACERFKQNLDSDLLAEPRLIQFKTGVSKKHWNKNCISLGLASGFLEPLESTSIHLIQVAISKFLAFFPSAKEEPIISSKFNALMKEEFTSVRDFLILHYKLTERDDSAFWRYCKSMEIPDPLSQKIALYRQCGRLHRDNNELFDEISQIAVMHGQGLRAERYHPLADDVNGPEFERVMEGVRDVIARAAEAMPPQEEYIRKNHLVSN